MQLVKSILIRDLDKLFTSISRENPNLKRSEVCNIIASSPAPQLYISAKYALRVIKGDAKCCAIKRTGLHDELKRRYFLLPPEERNLAGIEKIIHQPANSFYLSPKYIYVLLYKIYDRRK